MLPKETLQPHNIDLAARLIDAAGSPQFDALLMDAAHDAAGMDELFGYYLPDGGGISPFASASLLEDPASRVSQYVGRFFRHDPALHEHGLLPVGASFGQRVRVNDIIPHDYRRICYETPRFAEKLSFGWRDPVGLTVLSFYRRQEMDAEETRNLASLANLALAALRRASRPRSQEDFIARLEQGLRREFATLSARETEIVARTLAGWSAPRIARALAIAPDTVLTYRQRAYQRFGFCGSADFLPALLH